MDARFSDYMVQLPMGAPPLPPVAPDRHASALERLRARFDRAIGAYEQFTLQWQKEALQTEMEMARVSFDGAPSEEIERAKQFVAELEEAAYEAAEISNREQRKWRRKMRGLDPAAIEIVTAAKARLRKIDEIRIETLLHHSLLFRAILSELDPDAQSGQTFSDPAELARALRS